MNTIAHHTCDANGELISVDDIKKHGPFLSVHTPQSPKSLGTGYYFFDNNVTAAHAHGKNRYRREYHIFVSDICIGAADYLLDLVGNRNDMLFIQSAMKTFSANLDEENAQKWTLGALIEIMKEANAFAYRAVRILDSSIMEDKPNRIKETDRIYWFSDEDKFLNLNPIFTICFFEIDPIVVQSFDHYHSSTQ